MSESPFQQIMRELSQIKQAIESPRRPPRSIDINEYMKTFILLKADLEAIPKKGNNTTFNHKYCKLEDILEITEPILLKHGFVITETVEQGGQYGTFVCTMMHVESGQYMESRLPVLSEKDNPQAMGKCITFYSRYLRMALLGLEREDDDAESCVKR